MYNNKLWTFEHEPQTIDQMILTSDKKEMLKKIITDLPNTLITGKPGTGKGTFMNILLRENSQCNYLKINASMENSIDDVRDKIRNFATGYDPSNLKIVYLNECDRISIPGQDAMRQLIEDTQDITRFFLLANDESKITDALVSRCGYQFSLDQPPGKDILRYCFNILKKEGVTIKNKKAVVKLITKCYPDIRKIIGTLQSNVRDNIIDDILFNSAEDVYEKIVTHMKSMDLNGIRKELRSSYIDYDGLYKHLYEKVMSDEDYFSSPGVMIHTIGEFLYKNKDISIREVNFMTFVLDCAFKEAL